ncbi:MAG TPA: mechanosensitive ion channel domain-containing protein [Acidimicrobiia bacterium]|nr:mechanosensitive ion channel domain-containing protein [Acidimicrobiia bacterium]
MQDLADALGIPLGTLQNILWTLLVLITVLILRHLARRVVLANVDETETAAYRANKIINYMATTVFLVTVAFIWVDAFDNLPTYLGLLSAGIAIALADVLKNMAGWAYILSRKPFAVGDRIEVDGYKGDVVDVRLFRFSLMEIDGWVDAEQSTGRLVHVPNGVVFTTEVANYTEGFGYIWHEIPVLITFESDWKLAEQVMMDVLEREAPDVHGAAGNLIRETARRYSIRVGTLTPIVYLSVRDSGVLLTARYLVEARTRRGREDRIWRSILEAFAEQPSIDLAYPTVRTFLPDAIRVNNGG